MRGEVRMARGRVWDGDEEGGGAEKDVMEDETQRGSLRTLNYCVLCISFLLYPATVVKGPVLWKIYAE